MACLVVQHVEPERPFAIEAALLEADVQVEHLRVFAGDEVPRSASDLRGLVVMGGPMSARTEEGFPTRSAELALLADAVRREVPVLGVCLGAQLLAAGCGGCVLPGACGPEIGWGPVQLTPECASDELFGGMRSPLTVLHWHGETVGLPPGAVRLAGNLRYENQAFRLGASAWGLQFHVEIDEAAVSRFVDAFGDEARAAGLDPAEILGSSETHVAELVPERDELLRRFAAKVAASGGAGGPAQG